MDPLLDPPNAWRKEIRLSDERRTIHYDREGHPIDLDQWADLFGNDDYRRVAEDRIAGMWVSTVWLGIDHNFRPDDPPLIFETMVFDHSEHGERLVELDCGRYPSEAAAVAGHTEVVADLRAMVESLPPNVTESAPSRTEDDSNGR